MSDLAINVQGLGKRYRIGVEEEQHETMVGAVASWLKAPLKNYRRIRKLSQFDQDEADDIIWALRDINFQVRRGEVVGLIGHNGAGKSTLLKVLSRITEPTEGHAVMHGRISSLLEVGTGFHVELTGRENVYINGTILGMRKHEIDAKFDEIVAFSGVEKFIDTPVKRYSSGMKVRLGFAVAAHLEPEILLIDEVLAVGDVAFQKKCLGKMEDVTSQGRTVIFVSHSMRSIQNLCDRTILLDHGRVVADGATPDVVAAYFDAVEQTKSDHATLYDRERKPGHGERVRIRACRLLNADGEEATRLRFGEPFTVEMECVGIETVPHLSLVAGIDTMHGERIATSTTDEGMAMEKETPGVKKGRTLRAALTIDQISLMPGSYAVTLGITSVKGGLDHVPKALKFEVDSVVYDEADEQSVPGDKWGAVYVPPNWRVESRLVSTGA
jgi:lipopolysaccharide transport system ATP-binding protein